MLKEDNLLFYHLNFGLMRIMAAFERQVKFDITSATEALIDIVVTHKVLTKF